jgi:hypothetical protein
MPRAAERWFFSPRYLHDFDHGTHGPNVRYPNDISNTVYPITYPIVYPTLYIYKYTIYLYIYYIYIHYIYTHYIYTHYMYIYILYTYIYIHITYILYIYIHIYIYIPNCEPNRPIAYPIVTPPYILAIQHLWLVYAWYLQKIYMYIVVSVYHH